MMMNLFSSVEIEPQQFAGFSPALQTEALRLMAEAGLTVPRMRDATGLDCAEILTIGRRRHQVRAFDFERSAENTPNLKRGPKLSAASRLLLGLMSHNAGVLAESLTTVAYDLGISEKSAKAALQQLTAWAFVQKTRDGTGRVAAHYRLTSSGETLMAAQAEVAADE